MDLNKKVKLTNRELEIGILMCREKSSKQIAAELKIAIPTVDSHKKSLRKKTGSVTVIGVVIYCCKNFSHLLLYILSSLQSDLAEMIVIGISY